MSKLLELMGEESKDEEIAESKPNPEKAYDSGEGSQIKPFLSVYNDEMSDEPLYTIPIKTHDDNDDVGGDNYDFSDIAEAFFKHSNVLYREQVARSEGRVSGDEIYEYADDIRPNVSKIIPQYIKVREEKAKLFAPDPNFNLKEELQKASIPEDKISRFSGAVNKHIFDNVIANLEEEKETETILNDTSLWKGILPAIVSGTADPFNVIMMGGGLRFGSKILNSAIEGAIIGGANASARSTLDTNFDIKDVAYETAATSVVMASLTGAVEGVAGLKRSKIVSGLINDMKESLTPNFKQWFSVDNKEIYTVTGKYKHKAKRFVWEMINNSPSYQMKYSGDPVLENLSSKIFRDLSTPGYSASEALDYYASKEAIAINNIDRCKTRFLEEGGTLAEFNKEMHNYSINTYVDINTGEISVGKITEPEQLSLKGVAKKTKKPVRTKKLFQQDYEELLGGDTWEKSIPISNDPHIVEASNERMSFWREIIKSAKETGTLDREFGIGGISTDKKVLGVKEANMSATDFLELQKNIKKEADNIVSIGHIFRKYNKEFDSETVRSLLARELYLNNPELTTEQINKSVSETLAKITGNYINPESAEGVSSIVGFTKDRTVAVSDNLLSQAGLLDYDFLSEELGTWRQLVGESELNKAAIKSGEAESWTKLKEKYLNKSTQNISKTIGGNKTVTEKISEVYRYNNALLNDTERLVKGTYGTTDIFKNNRIWGWVNNAKGIAYLGMSGMLPLSMLTDGGMLVLKIGFKKSMKGLMRSVQSDLKCNNTRLPGLNSIKQEAVNNPQLMQKTFGFIEKQIDETRFISAPEENIHTNIKKAIAFTNKWTGMDLITKTFKTVASEGAYDKILTECISNPSESKLLRSIGISKLEAENISSAYSKFGYEDRSFKFLDPRDINDLSTEKTIRIAVESMMNQTILVPGIGNIPRYMRSSFGKMLYMFQSYPYMIFNDVIRPAFGGLMPEAPWLEAVGMSYALSATRKIMHDISNGKETDFESYEFWENVQQYSMTDFYMLDIIRKGMKVLNKKYGQSNINEISPMLSFFNSLSDMVGFNRTAKSVRNSIPVVGSWWARPLTNWLVE